MLVEDQIEDELAAVPGVADVQVWGDREKIFRIDVDQSKLASQGFTVADLRHALASVAFDSPAGSITTRQPGPDRPHHGRRDHARSSSRTSSSAATTHVRDVATVTLGPDIGQTIAALRRQDRHRHRHHPPGRIEHARHLRRRAGGRRPRSRHNLPAGHDIKVTSDDAVFVDGAVHEVEIALALSVSIVLIVIYVFLLDWRATLIPGLSMPVAMIGTIAAIYLAGFSINILTLLALVLATGLVVDDAIVVLENIVRRRNEGIGPARRRRARHPGGVLRGDRHDADAGRRLRADLLPARPDRRPVPRVRLRAGDLGAAVLRGGADALPDARLAHADRARRSTTKAGRHRRPDRRRARRHSTAAACMPASTRR